MEKYVSKRWLGQIPGLTYWPVTQPDLTKIDDPVTQRPSSNYGPTSSKQWKQLKNWR